MGRRNLIRRLWILLVTKLGWIRTVLRRIPGLPRAGTYTDMHTAVTFRAVTDAVLPRTPALESELGAEYVPGGVDVDLDTFAVTYVNNAFQFGLPHVGPRGNLPLAAPVANALDIAALKLLSRGRNESHPSPDRPLELFGGGAGSVIDVAAAAGPFAMLSREDRLRAISVLDEIEIEVAPFRGLEFEIDGGLVGQLVVGFTELLYYSEWQGYEAFTRPPSERVHSNDPSEVQSWRQTGYPGYASGYAALRGYVGTDESPLGGGDGWTVLDEDGDRRVSIVRESGSFRENDYDTSGYEEPYPEDD